MDRRCDQDRRADFDGFVRKSGWGSRHDMPRKPIGHRAMTAAERQRRCRERERAESDARYGRFPFDMEAIRANAELTRQALASATIMPADLAALEPDEGPMVVTDPDLIEFGARHRDA